MKKIKKTIASVLVLVFALFLTSAVMVACSDDEPPGPEPGGIATELPEGSAATVEVTGSYTSPVSINYMRLASNFYQTTASYQMLTTYEDGTYCFVTTTTTVSAMDIEWTDSDAGAKCNPRAVSFRAYYGECEENASSGGDTEIALSKPFRIIGGEVDGSGNVLYAYDTFNWEGYKPLNLAGADNKQLSTADEYRLSLAWNDMTVVVDDETDQFAKATLVVAPESERTLQTVPSAPGDTAGPAFRKTVSAYISLTDKAMGFEQLSDEKFRVAFQFQVLLNYDDGTYCLMHSAAVFMNLWINVATAGNDFSTENYGVEGGTGVEFTQYFGNYTAEDNPYDDTMENITLGDAIRVVATRTVGSGVSGQGSGSATAVSGYLADTMYWTAEMSAATGAADGAAYLEEEGFVSSVVVGIKESFTVTTGADGSVTAEGSVPCASIPFMKISDSGTLEPVR